MRRYYLDIVQVFFLHRLELRNPSVYTGQIVLYCLLRGPAYILLNINRWTQSIDCRWGKGFYSHRVKIFSPEGHSLR